MNIIKIYKKITVQLTKIAFLVTGVAIVGFMFAIVSDEILNLGWGYRWVDLVVVAGMAIAAICFYIFGRWWFRLLGFEEKL